MRYPKIFAGLAVGTLTLLAGGFWYSEWMGDSWREKVTESGVRGKVALPFALPDRNGKTHRLEDFRGKVTLIHFWATWCPPCVGEIPHILDFARSMLNKKERFRVVAISLDRNWKEAEKLLESNHLPDNMISLLDQDRKVSEQYGSFEYPESYLVDGNFNVIAKWVGPQDWNSERAKKLFDRLVP